MHPEPFETFIAPARRRAELWRLALGIGVIVIVYLSSIAMLWLLAGVLAAWSGLDATPDPATLAQSPVAVLLVIFSFLGMMLGVAAAVRIVHRRAVGTLFGARGRLRRDFGFGAAVILAAFVVAMALWPGRAELVAGTPWRLWLMLLPLALIGLAIQTAAEEMLFRGYLQQQLAARFRSALVWMLLPSALFGLLHYEPVVMGGNVWLVVAATGLFGLVAADLTARSGSLGLAWGLHFGNNAVALLLVSAGTGLEGLALYRLPAGEDHEAVLRPLILGDMAVMAALWGICRWWLRGR